MSLSNKSLGCSIVSIWSSTKTQFAYTEALSRCWALFVTKHFYHRYKTWPIIEKNKKRKDLTEIQHSRTASDSTTKVVEETNLSKEVYCCALTYYKYLDVKGCLFTGSRWKKKYFIATSNHYSLSLSSSIDCHRKAKKESESRSGWLLTRTYETNYKINHEPVLTRVYKSGSN